MGSKRHQNEPQNDAKTMPKWSQNDPNNDPGSTQKWSKITPKRPYFGPKWSQNGLKMGSKGAQTVQKSSRHSPNCIKTLKIHSGPFQTHPLTARFHRLKRRFWPFLSKTSVLQPKKASFCTILHNFDEFWQKFAYFCIPCIILLNFAVNFPKHHQKKTAKWP